MGLFTETHLPHTLIVTDNCFFPSNGEFEWILLSEGGEVLLVVGEGANTGSDDIAASRGVGLAVARSDGADSQLGCFSLHNLHKLREWAVARVCILNDSDPFGGGPPTHHSLIAGYTPQRERWK